MHDKFLRPYNPQETENAIYKKWEDSGYFNPDNLPPLPVLSGAEELNGGARNEPFTIVLPPPNVTGVLHIGGALMLTVEDIMVRFERMRGKATLWLPGTDSAAIATQARVEKDIQKAEKKSRYDLGREELMRRINLFVEENKNIILKQTRGMGASLDWSRLAYTMDETRYRAVMEAFVRMYDAGLIYRGHRIVNWDPKGQTTISDDEIVYKEEKSKFYYFQYGPFVIGTARPETKFGDKYVVMHPNDVRYKDYEHGQKIELEWINGPITATIIKDGAADPEVGSGVMTITPWHSVVDFEIAEKYALDKEQIIDTHGKLLPIAGEFAGMKIAEAREKIVETLDAKGLLVKVDDAYTHNIATAERTGATIEPQILEQWFVAVEKSFTLVHSEIPGIESGAQTTLKEIMRKSVENGAVKFVTERYERVYFHWIDNLRDWCISRQIWFGHRIPVWYRKSGQWTVDSGQKKEQEVYVGVTAPKDDPASAKTSAGTWEQDPDVLDTWFSSGLWTFSTLGWPEQTKDLKRFHPTSVIESGYDILFFWMARMILMSGFFLGQIPFKTIYIHGLVRDDKGRKLSKSAGNNIDPMGIGAQYGTDALRMGLIVGNTPGTDINFDPQKVGAYKKFANKLWNIARFILSETEGVDLAGGATEKTDHNLIERLNKVTADVTNDLEHFRYHLAAEKLYHYVWHEVADTILEESKPILNGDDAESKLSRQRTLYILLATSLKLLHPFMPFVTEEIWQHIPEKDTELLMVAQWPAKTG